MENKRAYWSIIIFVIAFIVFIGIYFFSIQSDHQTHVRWTSSVVAGNRSPRPNFLYQLVIYCVSLFNKEFLPLYFSSALVLAIAVAAKFSLSHRYIGNIIAKDIPQNNPIFAETTQNIVTIATIMLIFMFSLPLTVLVGGDFYLTNFPPNIWRNPTTILLMPFALGLFWTSYHQLHNPTTKNLILISLLCMLNVLIKPSFFFVFCVVYPLFLLRHYGLRKTFWINIIPVLLGGIFMIVEYYLLYIYAGLDDSDGGIAISLFTIWNHYSPSVTLSFIGSIFFPLLFFVFQPRVFLNSSLFKYTFSLFIVGVLIFCVFIETGERKYDGNFGWQYFVVNYMLYMVMTAFLIKGITQNSFDDAIPLSEIFKKADWKKRIIAYTFMLQFLLGVYYLYSIFFN